MEQAYDRFDLVSVEEMYDDSKLNMIECDGCNKHFNYQNYHTMQSFHSDNYLILCESCYRELYR